MPVVGGETPDRAVEEGLRRFRPDLVVDLSDEPVTDGRTRLRLAARVLAVGVPYQGADFRFDPPPRPRVATKPTVAIIGTGKRTGKTAVASSVARVLKARGAAPVIVAMSRGGPAQPEVIDPATFDLSPKGLLDLADSGRHAASDHIEDALTAGVVTVGTRRCGGGLAGAPAFDEYAAGVEAANAGPGSLVILEGSGQAVPPVHADATACVVPANVDPELAVGYLGAYRILLSDLIVITMAEQDSGAAALRGTIRELAPGARVVHTVFRPFPLEPISRRRVVYVTTAPTTAMPVMADHLQQEHGAMVVATSPHLGHGEQLRRDLETAPEADALLVELKGAAVDVAVRASLERGMDVVFCDNRVMPGSGGDARFDESAAWLGDLARGRFQR